MNNLIFGILILSSSSVNAQENTNDNGKLFSQIKNSQGIELRKNLNDLYSRYYLNKDQKYLIVNLNKHPGLICSSLISDTKQEIEIDYRDLNQNTQFIPLENSFDQIRTYTYCYTMPYISNSDETDSSKTAINQTIDSLIVSSTEVIAHPTSKIQKNRMKHTTGILKIESLIQKQTEVNK